MSEKLKHYRLSPLVLNFIINECNNKFPKETGGILVGYIEYNVAVIIAASGPGPKATHHRSEFRRDGPFSQNYLDQSANQTSNQSDYLGEWHSHPRNVGPSKKDLASMVKIRTSPAYAIESPILGLSICLGSIWEFRCFDAYGRVLLSVSD